MKYSNWDKFIGNWVNDMLKNGKMKYKNGEEYNGQFNNGKKEGKEIMINLNGDIYKGNFINDLKEGKGKMKMMMNILVNGKR